MSTDRSLADANFGAFRKNSPNLAVESDTLVGTLDYGPVQVAKGAMGYKHRVLAQDVATQMLSEPNSSSR
jgi:acetoacetate decarboxylase